MDVSVIIPIYNSERYLDKLFESLVKQKLKEIEFICVNDGSTDDSLKIIMKYKEILGEKLCVIDSENVGVWQARKIGMGYAKGEYIAFCDSDDYVDDDIYKKMYFSAKRKNADMVVCGFERIDGKSGKIISKEMNGFGNSTFRLEEKDWIFTIINTALWNKMIRREVLDKAIDFDNPPRVMEDAMFLVSIYPYIRTIAFDSNILYHYVVRAGTAMTYIKTKEIQLLCEDMIITRNHINHINQGRDFLAIMDTIAFIHLGISMPLKLMGNREINLNILVKKIKILLEQRFSQYKSLTFKNAQKKYLKQLWKIILARWMFNSRFYILFLQLYKFITQNLKIEIKW